MALSIKAKAQDSMQISSPEFKNNELLPAKFTCQGQGVNPTLFIDGLPKDAKSLVLIVDDPDAPSGNFVHWIVYDAPLIKQIAESAVFGKPGLNSLGKLGYVSPCPPSGTHRYFFKVYALDKMLNLPEGVSKADLENAMQSHILDQAQLIGLYKKQ